MDWKNTVGEREREREEQELEKGREHDTVGWEGEVVTRRRKCSTSKCLSVFCAAGRFFLSVSVSTRQQRYKTLDSVIHGRK